MSPLPFIKIFVSFLLYQNKVGKMVNVKVEYSTKPVKSFFFLESCSIAAPILMEKGLNDISLWRIAFVLNLSNLKLPKGFTCIIYM